MIPDIGYAPTELKRLYHILLQHRGRKRAIGMCALFERWRGYGVPRDVLGKPTVDVATLSRHMRKLIDDLRDLYGIPVMSSAKSGYWIAGDQNEVAEVVREFRARGLKSLATSARLKRISLADEVEQLALDLRTGKQHADVMADVLGRRPR